MANTGQITGVQLEVPQPPALPFSKGCTFKGGASMAGSGNALMPRGITVVGAASQSGTQQAIMPRAILVKTTGAASGARSTIESKGVLVTTNSKLSGVWSLAVPKSILVSSGPSIIVQRVHNKGRVSGFVFEVPAPLADVYSKDVTFQSRGKFIASKFTPVSAHTVVFRSRLAYSVSAMRSMPGPWTPVRTFNLLGQPTKTATFSGGVKLSAARGEMLAKGMTVQSSALLAGVRTTEQRKGILIASAGKLSLGDFVLIGYNKGFAIASAGKLSGAQSQSHAKGTRSTSSAFLALSRATVQSEGVLFRGAGSFNVEVLFSALFVKPIVLRSAVQISVSKNMTATKSMLYQGSAKLLEARATQITKNVLHAARASMAIDRSATITDKSFAIRSALSMESGIGYAIFPLGIVVVSRAVLPPSGVQSSRANVPG
jgi:hypothetical protein